MEAPTLRARLGPAMADEDEERFIIEPLRLSSSSSSTPGRVMASLLHSRPKHLEAAIAGVDSGARRNTGPSLDDSLRFVRSYAQGCVERGDVMDEILVPVIESSLKWKGLKYCKQALLLLNWLLEDEHLFEVILRELVNIIRRKEDKYIILGWCFLVRGFVENIMSADQRPDACGFKQNKQIGCFQILSLSISQLMSIISRGSNVVDDFELPTRLSVAAVDCVLTLTIALAKETSLSSAQSSKSNVSFSHSKSTFVGSVPSPEVIVRKNIQTYVRDGLNIRDMESLWTHFNDLVTIVKKLQAWNRKSRQLLAIGCGAVLKWLSDINQYFSLLKEETGEKDFKTGSLLLSSCWKHYGRLLHLSNHVISPDYKKLLDEYVSAIQCSSQDEPNAHDGRTAVLETKKFFLTCLCLLLGHIDSKQLKNIISEYEQQVVSLLVSQLQCRDEDVIELAVSMLRAFIFKSSVFPCGYFETEEMLPLLFNLLDERDNISRAVASLLAEYWMIMPNGQCLSEILKRLDFGDQCQRMNAIDVIGELINLSSVLKKELSPSLQKILAEHLLKLLEDEDYAILSHISNLLQRIDAAYVLPILVPLIYRSEERVQSSAANALSAVLKFHSMNVEIIVLLLDTLRDLSQQSDIQKSRETCSTRNISDQSGSKLDVDRIFNLISSWAGKEDYWNALVECLINKMFSEPSNALIVRLMSCLSERLADAKDLVLSSVLSRMLLQNEMEEGSSGKHWDKSSRRDNPDEMQDTLFDRLSPMLVLRILPMRIYSDLSCSFLYGCLSVATVGDCCIDFDDRGSVSAFLLGRMFNPLEFEEVRKLAAELCGRLHPQVVLPIMLSQLQSAAELKDMLNLKACLFTVCTSLVIWGKETVSRPEMLKMRELLDELLLVPSLENTEVYKVQHGCIDCLALMICSELQHLQQQKDSSNRDAALNRSIVSYVVKQFSSGWKGSGANHMDGHSDDTSPVGASMHIESSKPITYRLCMANILISAFQKISDSGKQLFAHATIPLLTRYAEIDTNLEIRAACLQVLFSSVYHLKYAILPYSSQLLKLSVKALKNGSTKEKIAGAKLVASLMGSEDEVVESISGGLLEVKSTLAGVSSCTTSPELKQLCDKLLLCVSPPFRE